MPTDPTTPRQQVLVMVTEGHTLRSEAVGWTHEDGTLVQPGAIGHTRGPRPYAAPATPLHALGDGWSLLAPPTREGAESTWWFVRMG